MSVRLLALALLSVAPTVPAPPQATAQVLTADIDRFWSAYDAVRAESDPAKKLALIQSLYIDPGTPGLHALMAARRYTAAEYVKSFEAWPQFWASIRPMTYRASAASAGLTADLAKFRALYPALRPASITYAIGVLRTGGTISGNLVLIGAEIALADETVDVSELPEPLRTRLRTYFATRPFENNGQNNIHEYVHTQQQESAETLTARAVYEGVAEFVAERITGKKPKLALYEYGPAHRALIRDHFRADMAKTDWSDWLYNGTQNVFGVGDLGYYAGYEIASATYAKAKDKTAAIREMIELPYGDDAAVRAYIARSGYLEATL